MNRIIFSVGIGAAKALGTVTRMVAVAQEAVRLEPQTEILFRADGEEADYVQNNGFKVIGGYTPTLFGIPSPLLKLGSLFRKPWDGTIPAVRRMEDVYRLKGIHTRSYVEHTYSEWDELISEFRPDVIVAEFDMIAVIAARKQGIRILQTFSTPAAPKFYSELFYNHYENGTNLHRHYNRLLQRLGLPLIDSIAELFAGYDWAERLIPSIPQMEDFLPDARTHFVGNLIPEKFCIEPFTWQKQRPLIFVYLSMGQYSGPERVQVLSEAFSDNKYDVIVANPGHPYFEKLPDFKKGNIYFKKFVSTQDILSLSDLVIHHGGQNTTMQCIESRLPALIFPGLHFERHYNGRKAQEIGCAYCLGKDRFNPVDLRSLCNELIDKNPFKENLDYYSHQIQALGGRRKAAQIALA